MNLNLNADGVATAELNPGAVLDMNVDYFPLLTPGTDDGAYLVTILKAGGAGDVAAYRAIVAASSLQGDRNGAAGWVGRYGSKISEKEASKLFDWQKRGEWRR
jgi:hypothetical protein